MLPEQEVPVDMAISDAPVENTQLWSKQQTLEQISQFQQHCEHNRKWAARWSTRLFVASLVATTATTVSTESAGIAPENWKWLTVVLGGLGTVSVGIKDYLHPSSRHAFYRRAIVECDRLRFACLEAGSQTEVKAIQDKFFLLREGEAESAVRVDATRAPKIQNSSQK
jgi:hypothetical protein